MPRPVRFEVTIPTEQRDPGLAEKLSHERDGILTWAVQGCLDWQQTGLHVPDAVRAATADYRAASDTLGAFLDEATVSRPHVWVSSAGLYEAWGAWATDHGERPGTQNALSRRLTERGYQTDRTGSASTRIWRGLALSTDATDTTDTTPRKSP